MYTRAKENSTGLIEQHVCVRLMNSAKVKIVSTRKKHLNSNIRKYVSNVINFKLVKISHLCLSNIKIFNVIVLLVFKPKTPLKQKYSNSALNDSEYIISI
jgi:polynucleotide 5'-kinase involved in rRNA processing